MNAQSMDSPEVRELLKAIYSAVFISDDAIGLMKFLSQEAVEDLHPKADFLPANIVEILTACSKRANADALEAIEQLKDLLGIAAETPLFTHGEAFSIFKEAPRPKRELHEGWMDEVTRGSSDGSSQTPAN